VILLNDKQYWLYPTGDPESNEFLYKRPEMTRNMAIANSFFRELGEKHRVLDVVVLADGDASLHYAC
jgi:putative transposase